MNLYVFSESMEEYAGYCVDDNQIKEKLDSLVKSLVGRVKLRFNTKTRERTGTETSAFGA